MDWIPPTLLGKWQLLTCTMGLFNVVQNFITLNLTQRVYNNVPKNEITPLQARTFSAWTLMSVVVRFYAAYNIHEKRVYDMALFSYLIAFGHFVSEILIFRTARPGPVLSTVVVATTSLVWMLSQYKFYVGTPLIV
ncbi:Erg28 like protein-domain-containing protein [Flagelloscypha sp. PMI_526]|nr:Erg28 like protein-domain-containing protein [Flagelloscypha sp. PMI_526]